MRCAEFLMPKRRKAVFRRFLIDRYEQRRQRFAGLLLAWRKNSIDWAKKAEIQYCVHTYTL